MSSATGSTKSFRIATWNVNSLRVRMPHVRDWLQQNKPDVLALQETKLTDENFPEDEFKQLGYQVIFSGQKTYNGVAIISCNKGNDVISTIPGFPDEQKRVLGASFDGITILNLYVPNGSEVGSDKYHYKLEWLSHVSSMAAELKRQNPNVIILGDFNIAPEDQDVHDPQAWEGSVLVSPAERDSLRKLLAHGYIDIFRQFEHEPATFSWWDYRAAAFRRNHGLRIDLILASTALAPRCRNCMIDKGPRKLERPSDHTPVMAEFELG